MWLKLLLTEIQSLRRLFMMKTGANGKPASSSDELVKPLLGQGSWRVFKLHKSVDTGELV